MRRGERKLYREIAEAAKAVAESRNYAEEYVAKNRLLRADTALGEWAMSRSASREKIRAL